MTIYFSTGLRDDLLGVSDLKTVFTDCIVELYSGTQPADADQSPTGVLLATVTESGGAFAHGAAANGLEFDAPVSAVLSKAAAETWRTSGSGQTPGTMGWFRIKANPTDNDSVSTTLPRIDGSIGTSGADINMSNTVVTASGVITFDQFDITLNASPT